jgi:hypothetical protein
MNESWNPPLKQRKERSMECLKCGGTDTRVGRVEHIYPVRVLGMPAFWKWVSPGTARAILAATFALCACILAFSLALFSRRADLAGTLCLILFLFASSIFIRCAGALKHYKRKLFYRCGSCGLEWSPPEL